MRDESVDESHSPDFKSMPERAFDHPDQDRKTKPEHDMENKGKYGKGW